jgi:ABC-type Zn uptake system ZnuABC Zn-binding protein ZnuA
MKRGATVCLAFAILLAGCGPRTAQAPDGRLPVVATFSVLGDLVRNIGGEHVSVTVLAGPGVDTHTFEPTAADGVALANARLIFENGLDFETWLDDVYQAAGSKATRIVVSDGIAVIEGEHAEEQEEGEDRSEDEAGAEADHEAGDEHGHGEYDPHVWHSAANAIVMARNIGEALAAADPENATSYQDNAEAYTTELETLDAWITAQVSTLPAKQRKLVTTHDTFAYFAEQYGFEVIGTLLPTSTEGASPSAQELAALVEAVRAAGVPAVFAETVSNNSLLEQVSTEAGVAVVTLYTDALGPEGSPGGTYLDMMRANVNAIVTALGGAGE